MASAGGHEVEAAAASPPSPKTPRLRLPRFSCAWLRFVRLGRKGVGGGQKEVAAEKSEAALVDSSGWKAGCSGSSASTEAGMGLSLLFLLVKTCVELNKMAEVRAQMEALLKETRDQACMKSTDHAVVPRICNLQPPSTASSRRGSEVRMRIRTAMRLGHLPVVISEDEGSARIDVLEEAEFEIEPGQFQLNCNTEQETSESSDDEFIELEGGFGGAGDLRRDSEDGDEEHGAQYDNGGSSLEQERRLHEPGADRGAGVGAAARGEKLVEKEMVARLWNTAKLARQQPQDGQ